MLMRLFQGTWFDVGLGACGEWNVNSDKIVAISSQIYGSGGNCNQVSPRVRALLQDPPSFIRGFFADIRRSARSTST